MTDMRAMFALARPAFGDFIAIVHRRWWLIAGVAIVGAAWMQFAQAERWDIHAAALLVYPPLDPRRLLGFCGRDAHTVAEIRYGRR